MKRRGFIASLLTAAVTPWTSIGVALQSSSVLAAELLVGPLYQQELLDLITIIGPCETPFAGDMRLGCAGMQWHHEQITEDGWPEETAERDKDIRD